METPRNCLECTHCYLNNAQPRYSEVTPSSPMTFECLKNHWKFDQYEVTKQGLKVDLDLAIHCPDYNKEEQ